jgi:hypothetical protein
VSELVTKSNTPQFLKEDGYTADDGTDAGQIGRKCKNLERRHAGQTGQKCKTQCEDRKIDKEEMIVKMDANTEATLATKEETRADRGQRKAEMEEILEKMEERMTSTQAKTGGNLKELTDTIEKHRWNYKL